METTGFKEEITALYKEKITDILNRIGTTELPVEVKPFLRGCEFLVLYRKIFVANGCGHW